MHNLKGTKKGTTIFIGVHNKYSMTRDVRMGEYFDMRCYNQAGFIVKSKSARRKKSFEKHEGIMEGYGYKTK